MAITRAQDDFNNNMTALVDYFNQTEAVTPEAVKIKNDFATWQSNLGWYALHVDNDTTWNQARNFRSTFERANATTQQERAQVERVIKTGMTTEQQYGQAPVARTAAGLYAAPSTKPPLIPPEYKWAAVVVVAGSVLLFAYGLSASAPAAIAAWASRPKRAQS